MESKTFIILGSSGCGKGTQAGLIREYLKENSEREVTDMIMGDLFRAFWKEEGYTSGLSREILHRGGLQPSFLQIYLWSTFFIEHLTGDEHLIIDGVPRRVEDARAMDGAFSFYNRPKPVVVYLKVSREWAREKLVERAKIGSSDPLRALEDKDEKKIDGRLDWFEEFALPALEYFRDKTGYTFIEVNGEQSIDDVHDEIVERAFE